MASPPRAPGLLMVTPNFPPDVGGMQTYSLELARQFSAQCGQFAVLAPWRPGCARIDRALPFRVIRRPSLGDNQAFSGILPVSRFARDEGFEIAFCTHWSAAFAALNTPSGWPRSVVCAAHGKELLVRPLAKLGPLQGVYDRVRGHALRRSDRFVAVSRYTAGLLREAGVAAERIAVVPNGVDPEAFAPAGPAEGPAAPAGEGAGRLLTVARLVARKGVERVLEALPGVRRSVPGVTYRVVGDGPDRTRLQKRAAELGVADIVTWSRGVDREALVRAYNECDLFVMPSSGAPPDVEGFGLTFLEAGACGKPVLGSTEGGIPDAILDGETGLTIDLADPGGLERGIVALLTDPARARAMGEAGRRHVVAEANWARTAERILQEAAALTAPPR